MMDRWVLVAVELVIPAPFHGNKASHQGYTPLRRPKPSLALMAVAGVDLDVASATN